MNSFSHVDLTSESSKATNNDTSRKLASILIDADAGTPIFQ